MVGANGLITGGNQVFFCRSIWIVRLSRNFVQLFVKVFQLRDTRHGILVQNVWRLQNVVSAGCQESDAVTDDCLIQHDPRIGEKVGTPTF